MPASATTMNGRSNLLPRLRERLQQQAGTLSGGEQQMLAIGRALLARPRLLMLDEPSLGLAPQVVQTVFQVIREIAREGTTILLVEQNASMALQVANRAYVLEVGEIQMEARPASWPRATKFAKPIWVPISERFPRRWNSRKLFAAN